VGRSVAIVPKVRQAPRREPDRTRAESVFRSADHDVLDEHALVLLIQYEEILERAGELPPELIRRPENRALLSALRAAGTIEGTYAWLDDAAVVILDQLKTRRLPPADRKQRAADWQACLRRMKERYLRELKAQEEMALALDADDAAPADSGYRDAVDQQALETNERLRDLFVSGAGAP